MNSHKAQSVETPYGWVVVGASNMMVATAIGASYLIIVSLKPIAADFDWPRWIPSLAYSMVMLGAGIGGIVMGFWSDRRGMGGPATLGAVMVGTGAIVVSVSNGYLSLLFSCGLLVGFLGVGTVLSPLLTNATRWFDRRRFVLRCARFFQQPRRDDPQPVGLYCWHGLAPPIGFRKSLY